MSKSKIIIAIGGNAIEETGEKEKIDERFRSIDIICRQVLEIIRRGYKVVITHGNGPQIGNLIIQQEETKKLGSSYPLDVNVAMTQGQIGYILQKTLMEYLKKNGLNLPVATIITQVLVSKDDLAFNDPSKPVGPFYTYREAKKIMKEKYCVIKKVKPSGRKPYRRVVPSPDPVTIIEKGIIKKMVDTDIILIASGGGGIPITIGKDGNIVGIEAVIDKDLTGAKLAEIVGADKFLILTDVEKVKLNYGKYNEIDLNKITLDEAKRYLKEGHFIKGSMEQKIISCIRFLQSGGKEAIITSLDKAIEGLEGRAGTLILNN